MSVKGGGFADVIGPRLEGHAPDREREAFQTFAVVKLDLA